MTGSVIDRRICGKVLTLVLLSLILLAVPSVASADIFSSDTRQIEVASICESRTDSGSTVVVIIDADGMSWTVDKRDASFPKIGETIEAHFENGKIVSWRDVSKAELKARSDAIDRKLNDGWAFCLAFTFAAVPICVFLCLLMVLLQKAIDRY